LVRIADIYKRGREPAVEILRSQGYSGEGDDASVKEFVRRVTSDKSGPNRSLIKLFGKAFNLMAQQFIESELVENPQTGKPHFAKARLIWFDGYQGGYWALSKHPAGEEPQTNPIVNYCNGRNARAFTPEENERFTQYANRVVPVINGTVKPFIGNTRKLNGVLKEIYRESIVRATSI
jgi:hypothetical protein